MQIVKQERMVNRNDITYTSTLSSSSSSRAFSLVGCHISISKYLTRKGQTTLSRTKNKKYLAYYFIYLNYDTIISIIFHYIIDKNRRNWIIKRCFFFLLFFIISYYDMIIFIIAIISLVCIMTSIIFHYIVLWHDYMHYGYYITCLHYDIHYKWQLFLMTLMDSASLTRKNNSLPAHRHRPHRRSKTSHLLQCVQRVSVRLHSFVQCPFQALSVT